MPLIDIKRSDGQSHDLSASISHQLSSSALDAGFQRIHPGSNTTNPGKRHTIDMAACQVPCWYMQWFMHRANFFQERYGQGDLALRFQFVDQQRTIKERKDFAPLSQPEQRGKSLFLFQSLLKHYDALSSS